MTNEARIYNEEKIISSSSTRKTGQLHVKEWDKNIPSHHIKKQTQNGLKTNLTLEIIKLLEEYICRTLSINHRNIFLYQSPKAK